MYFEYTIQIQISFFHPGKGVQLLPWTLPRKITAKYLHGLP